MGECEGVRRSDVSSGRDGGYSVCVGEFIWGGLGLDGGSVG